MSIAFVTPRYEGADVQRGSGTFYYMSQEIERQGHKVHYIGPVNYDLPLISRISRSLHYRAKKQYALFLDPFAGKRTGRAVTKKLAGLDVDLLITNDCTVAAYVDTPVPVVLYTDVMITPDYLERTLPGAKLGNLSALSLWNARKSIRDALRRADLSVFPARWSAEAARHYTGDTGKIVVIPFGANIEDPGAEPTQRRQHEGISGEGPIRFLFVGKDWKRKGGDVAVAVAEELRHRGIESELHIVGTQPPAQYQGRFLKVHGLLDKADPEQNRLLTSLYASCDIFLMPSSNEGYGIAPVEAAAYGLPVLAYAVSGIETAVRDGVSGVLLPLGGSAEAFADVVEGWLERPDEYKRLVRGGRAHYEQNANWAVAIGQLLDEIGARFPHIGIYKKQTTRENL